VCDGTFCSLACYLFLPTHFTRLHYTTLHSHTGCTKIMYAAERDMSSGKRKRGDDPSGVGPLQTQPPVRVSEFDGGTVVVCSVVECDLCGVVKCDVWSVSYTIYE
jgi:hypothetical protein